MFGPLASQVVKRYQLYPGETWQDIAWRVTSNVLNEAPVPISPDTSWRVYMMIRDRVFMPGGRYLYATGRKFHQVQNCILLRPEDTREGWGEHVDKCMRASMTGAGIGANYSALRAHNTPLHSGGGVSGGPLSLMIAANEVLRSARQGGGRRAAKWAGLRWDHPDIFEFIRAKNWPQEIQALKAKNPDFPAPLDYTNISVCLNSEFFEALSNPAHPKASLAYDVFWLTLKNACKTGDPGLSVDCGENAGEDLRNACTEVTSSDDSDICNLGSINLARIRDLNHMQEVVELATLFLLCGTLYSDVPYPKVAEVRSKNRRLGLGLMGVHEWLISRGKPYAPDSELEDYLLIYQQSAGHANEWADRFGISTPVKTRAIAPTGTIGILAETTTGIEPIFAAAYKRRYYENDTLVHQIVIDPTAKRLVEQGIDPDAIEDSYTLAGDIERRVAFQAWIQRYVDHGISSTINLPAWGSDLNNEDRLPEIGAILLKHLPNLRGITLYPDGARSGQPLTSVPLKEALASEGRVYSESIDVCDLRGGSSCGA